MKSAKLILVDDEPEQSEYMAFILQEMGYSILAICTTPLDAIAKSKTLRPDLILMDINLGDDALDGIELAKIVRKQYGINSVFVTGYPDNEVVERASTAGALGFVTKPFEKQALKATLAIVLYSMRLKERDDPHYQFSVDTNLGFTACNQNFQNTFGQISFSGEQSRLESMFVSDGASRLTDACNKLLLLKKPGPITFTLKRADGGPPIHLETEVEPVLLRDKVMGLHFSGIDVTNQHVTASENERAYSLTKDLMREIHHRVRNNLQGISGLLALAYGKMKSSNFGQTVMEDVIRDTEHRIVTMAQIHELLYESYNNSSVTIDKMFQQLTQSILELHRIEYSPTIADLVLSPMQISYQHATPCALIFHELLVNTIKHGRNNAGLPAFRLEIIHNGTSSISIAYRDYGPGFDESLFEQRASCYGLRLISDLIQQLQATARFDSRDGASLSLEFVERIN